MGVAGSCGAGLLALICCRRATIKLLVLNYAFTIPHITLPLDDKRMKQTNIMHARNPVICKTCNTLKRPRSVGKENACQQGDNIPPPKRGRKNKVIDDEHKCGSCTVWLQTGGNEKLLKYHNMDKGRVRHPGDKSVEFSIFLSCNGAHNITLRSDSLPV